MDIRKIRRRSGALVVLLGLVALGGIAFAPAGDASWCSAPPGDGNFSHDAGVTAVGVAQSNIGNPDSYSFYACNDPGYRVYLSTTNDDSAAAGHQATLTTCPLFAGCFDVVKTGVEVGTPSTSVDPPVLDTNGRVGATLQTGSGACVWTGGRACYLGGGTYSASQPLPELVPNQGDVDAVMYAADWPNRCINYINWAGIDFGIFFCAWDAENVPGFIVSALTT